MSDSSDLHATLRALEKVKAERDEAIRERDARRDRKVLCEQLEAECDELRDQVRRLIATAEKDADEIEKVEARLQWLVDRYLAGKLSNCIIFPDGTVIERSRR